MCRTLRWTVTALTLAAIYSFAGRACAAQASAAQPSAASADATKLFQALDDIDKLRILNPLHLTADQLDKLVSTIEQSQKDYNKAIEDAAVPPIRKLGDQILQTRAALLAGGGVPSDFDETIKKLQSDFVASKKSIEANAVLQLATSIKAIYTPDQYAAALQAFKDYLRKSGTKAQGTDDQFFNMYVSDTFMVYPRIIPLLKEMRTASAGGTGQPAQAPQQPAAR